MDDFAQELAAAYAESTTCACMGLGVLGAEWAFKRDSHCTCSKQTDDFETVFHDVQCDTIPCPFCVLLGKISLHP